MSRFPHDMSYFGSPGTVPPHFSGLGLGGDTFSASKPSSSSEASHVASVNCKDASFEREWPQQMDNFLKPQESDLNGLGDTTMINANAKVEELEAQLTHWKRVKDEGDALAKENAKKFGPYSVRIFWDYQNLPLPAKAEGNEIMDGTQHPVPSSSCIPLLPTAFEYTIILSLLTILHISHILHQKL